MTSHGAIPSAFSPALAQAVGFIVLEATDAEDSIGDLIVLRTGMCSPDPRWWRSGEALVSAVKAIGDPELRPIVDLLSELLDERHNVVHGLFLEGASETFMTMRRGKTKKGEAPSYQLQGGGGSTLADLAHRFRVLDRMAEDAISDAMGIERGQGSILPKRVTPVVLPDRANPP